MRTGNGNFSMSAGSLTMASHCSPILMERRPSKGGGGHKFKFSNKAYYLPWWSTCIHVGDRKGVYTFEAATSINYPAGPPYYPGGPPYYPGGPPYYPGGPPYYPGGPPYYPGGPPYYPGGPPYYPGGPPYYPGGPPYYPGGATILPWGVHHTILGGSPYYPGGFTILPWGATILP